MPETVGSFIELFEMRIDRFVRISATGLTLHRFYREITLEAIYLECVWGDPIGRPKMYFSVRIFCA